MNIYNYGMVVTISEVIFQACLAI